MTRRQSPHQEITGMERHHLAHARFMRVLLLAVATAAALFAVRAPAAHAGLLVRSADTCASETLERPFLRWGDGMSYVLAPDGTVEAGTGWHGAGAEPVAGNEPYYVHAPGERSSLALPPGTSATTAPMCVGIEHPTLRFFARNAGSPLSTLLVAVRFQDVLGLRHTLPIGALLAGPDWAPTPPFLVVANLLPLLPGERTPVQFVFTPVGPGDWRIDDVYVDPYRK
jgi:hypothetical protein